VNGLYLASAIVGHCRLMLARRPIQELIDSPGTPAALREALAFVLRVRRFASTDLGLPENGSYKCYSELNRPFATWNVFAAPQLTVEPVTWRFPIVGAVVYRGYARQDGAERFAAGLRANGFDTYIHGSPAYSTLGWFDDPVLNTFIHFPPHELAGLILHELAHQKLFMRDDTFSSEAFAVAVERDGVRRFLIAEGQVEALAAWEDERRENDLAAQRLLEARKKLASLYASDLARGEKLRQKEEILQATGLGPGLNNAYLVRVAAYYSNLPGFEALLRNARGDLMKFYSAAGELVNLPSSERRKRLLSVAETQ
jgi:predicted aminopeptidase